MYDCYAGPERPTHAGAVARNLIKAQPPRPLAIIGAADHHVKAASGVVPATAPQSVVKEKNTSEITEVLRKRLPCVNSTDVSNHCTHGSNGNCNGGSDFTQHCKGNHGASGKCNGAADFKQRCEGNHDASEATATAFMNATISNSSVDSRGAVTDASAEALLDSELARLPCKVPVVLPMYHVGMDTVLPNQSPYIPRVGQRVTVLVGEPLYLGKLISTIEHSRLDRVEARRLITDRIQEEMLKLRVQAELLHEKQSSVS